MLNYNCDATMSTKEEKAWTSFKEVVTKLSDEHDNLLLAQPFCFYLEN